MSVPSQVGGGAGGAPVRRPLLTASVQTTLDLLPRSVRRMFVVRIPVPELLRFTPRPDALDHVVSMLRALEAGPEPVDGSSGTWRVLHARDRVALEALQQSLRAAETGARATSEDHYCTSASSVTVRPDAGGHLLERRRDAVRLLHFFLARAQLPFRTEGRDTLVVCPPHPPQA